MGFIMTSSHTSFSPFHCLPLSSAGSFHLTDLVSSHIHAFFPLLADLGVSLGTAGMCVRDYSQKQGPLTRSEKAKHASGLHYSHFTLSLSGCDYIVCQGEFVVFMVIKRLCWENSRIIVFNYSISGQALWNTLFYLIMLSSRLYSCGSRLCVMDQLVEGPEPVVSMTVALMWGFVMGSHAACCLNPHLFVSILQDFTDLTTRKRTQRKKSSSFILELKSQRLLIF